MVAPPTPEKLEQDKQHVEEQFDRAFALVEQLAKDTEELKTTEQQRSEKLDNALSDLEVVMADLKTANRRRDDDAQRIREEIQGLKDAIPKALDAQKNITDNRLYEINTELTSLKTLVSQRMSSAAGSSTTNAPRSPAPATPSPAAAASSTPPAPTVSNPEPADEPAKAPAAEAPKSLSQGSFNKPSAGKASIPAWQMAMANKGSGSATTNGASSSSAGDGASSSA